MNFEQLVGQIRSIHDDLARQASNAVNLGLTLRNWLIGCHIQEYELRGEDRSEYGAHLFDVLAGRLVTLKLPNCSRRQLYRYRDFYRTYPQIVGTLSPLFRRMVPTRLPKETVGTLSPQSKELTLTAEKLIETLSYSHFELLAAIDSPQKRTFYEIESVRGTWSVRELKRQIASLYYERSGLSRDKKKLAALVDAKVEHSTPALTIRDPYVFEFLGVHSQEVMPESRGSRARHPSERRSPAKPMWSRDDRRRSALHEEQRNPEKLVEGREKPPFSTRLGRKVPPRTQMKPRQTVTVAVGASASEPRYRGFRSLPRTELIVHTKPSSHGDRR